MPNTLTLHNDIKEVELLPAWLETLSETMPLNAGDVMQLNLAIEEAVVNVMEYAFPNGDKHEFTLTAEVEDNKGDAVVKFVLTDDGIPFDPTKEEDPDVTLSAEERQIGGLGIFLVKNIMQSVEYSRVDGQNVLTMKYKPQI